MSSSPFRKITSKPYRCRYCEHVYTVATNHVLPIYSPCPKRCRGWQGWPVGGVSDWFPTPLERLADLGERLRVPEPGATDASGEQEACDPSP